MIDAVLRRWESYFSVLLDGGAVVTRRARRWLELFGELQQPLKGKTEISVLIAPEAFLEGGEAQSIGTLSGNSTAWSVMLFVTEAEFTHLLTSAASAATVRLTLGCSKPRYRTADVRYMHIDAAGPMNSVR